MFVKASDELADGDLAPGEERVRRRSSRGREQGSTGSDRNSKENDRSSRRNDQSIKESDRSSRVNDHGSRGSERNNRGRDRSSNTPTTDKQPARPSVKSRLGWKKLDQPASATRPEKKSPSRLDKLGESTDSSKYIKPTTKSGMLAVQRETCLTPPPTLRRSSPRKVRPAAPESLTSAQKSLESKAAELGKKTNFARIDQSISKQVTVVKQESGSELGPKLSAKVSRSEELEEGEMPDSDEDDMDNEIALPPQTKLPQDAQADISDRNKDERTSESSISGSIPSFLKEPVCNPLDEPAKLTSERATSPDLKKSPPNKILSSKDSDEPKYSETGKVESIPAIVTEFSKEQTSESFDESAKLKSQKSILLDTSAAKKNAKEETSSTKEVISLTISLNTQPHPREKGAAEKVISTAEASSRQRRQSAEKPIPNKKDCNKTSKKLSLKDYKSRSQAKAADVETEKMPSISKSTVVATHNSYEETAHKASHKDATIDGEKSSSESLPVLPAAFDSAKVPDNLLLATKTPSDAKLAPEQEPASEKSSDVTASHLESESKAFTAVSEKTTSSVVTEEAVNPSSKMGSIKSDGERLLKHLSTETKHASSTNVSVKRAVIQGDNVRTNLTELVENTAKCDVEREMEKLFRPPETGGVEKAEEVASLRRSKRKRSSGEVKGCVPDQTEVDGARVTRSKTRNRSGTAKNTGDRPKETVKIGKTESNTSPGKLWFKQIDQLANTEKSREVGLPSPKRISDEDHRKPENSTSTSSESVPVKVNRLL